MKQPMDRRALFRQAGAMASVMAMAQAFPGMAAAGPAAAQRMDVNDPRFPKVLTVEYTYRDHEVVDYRNYSLDSMPRIRFRGPRFDPRAAEAKSFFTAFGSAHTLGVFSPVTYTEILAGKLGLNGWNVGVGGISASFYNRHPQIIEYANRGAFAIVQITAARLESNDRIQTTPAAQIVFDRKHGDFVSPELVWARIEKEEPENLAKYRAQSRTSWAAEHRKLLEALEVPTLLFWFSARPMQTTDSKETQQVGSTAVTAFPQYVDGTDIAKIEKLADGLAVCVTSRGADYPLTSRFTGEPVSVNHRLLPEGRGPASDLIDDRNSYYPSPEMHEDAAAVLLEKIKGMSLNI